jgi:hypothetical protein
MRPKAASYVLEQLLLALFIVLLPVMVPTLYALRRGQLRGKGGAMLLIAWPLMTALWALVIAVAARHGWRGVIGLGIAGAALAIFAVLIWGVLLSAARFVAWLSRTRGRGSTGNGS